MSRRTWDPEPGGSIAADRWQLARTLPARIDALEAFCLEVRQRLKPEASAADWYAVELLLREALTNAVLHGADDPSRQVVCEVTIARRVARLVVTDEGPGFDWRRALSAVTAETATSGRGLKIYQLYADRVSFNEAGNRVVLYRRLGRI